MAWAAGDSGARILNLAQLEEISGGDEAFASELLGEFDRLLCDEVPKLLPALEDRRLDEVRSIAHALKGAGATIGAEACSKAAKDLEAACRNRDLRAAYESVSELEGQASRFLAWLESPARAA